MLLTVAALALAISQQDKAIPVASTAAKSATPPVDRSAEPALKSLFAESGALRGVHITVEVYPRVDVADRYDDDSSMDIWIGDGGRFRFQTSSNYWGGGSLFVSDGEALLTDDMSDDGSIRISKPKKTFHELSDQEAILYALEGQAGFDALVDKDKPLKFVGTSNDGGQVIELNSKKLGKVILHYRAGSPIPTAIESYSVPWWEDDKTKVPDKPTNREVLSVVSHGPIDSSLFRVAAPKGKKVTDERETKKG
jgi:hypothetical protein